MPGFKPKTYYFKAGFGEAEVLAMREAVTAQVVESGVTEDTGYAFVNVLDEFCCNIMEHGRAEWLEMTVEPGEQRIYAVLRDNGVEFDPVQAIKELESDQPARVTERHLGLYMAGMLARDLRYEREKDGVNRLVFSMPR